MRQPIILGKPTWDQKKGELKFSEEDQAKIADVEARTAALMRQLGSVAGTQNIDRILRLPGTTNLPNERKLKVGRTACPAKLVWCDGATCELDDFSAAPIEAVSEITTAILDWDEVAKHVDWLKSEDDLPENFNAKGRMIIAHTGTIADLNADLMEAGLLKEPYTNNWSSVSMALAAIFKADGSFSTEEIAAALMSPLHCNQHISRQKDRRRAVERLIRRSYEPRQPTTGRTMPPAGNVSLDDFQAYLPQHVYVFLPTREPWPASSVDARLGHIPLFDAKGQPVLNDDGEQKTARASLWLDWHHPVEQMTWAPGSPPLIRNRLIAEGGWIERRGATCLNLYRPPTIIRGNAAEAGPWLEHLLKVYGDDSDHIQRYLAQRVQQPEIKINHALLLGGSQGIGKDTILEPVKRAVGPWNFSEISPQTLLGQFNGFLKAVILRVNEARDLGDVNRYQFYDHMKAYTAAPPDVLRVDEKHLREHAVLNCCGVIITTNYKSDGVYLPADDRRHFVAWSDLTKENFAEDYWKQLWGWYDNGGYCHVAAYLAELDLKDFDPKAPPPKTQAFWEIVDANRAPEDAELADVIDKLKNPDALTIYDIQINSNGSLL